MNQARLTFALLLLPCVFLCCRSVPEQVYIKKGAVIPDFQLITLDGATVDRDSLAGKPVVLNFWATWCGPCTKEIPALKEVARSGAAKVIAISLDEQGDSQVRSFVKRHRIDYTVLLEGSEVFERFEGWAIPYTLVLDASSTIVSIHHGLVSRHTLERDLRKARSSGR